MIALVYLAKPRFGGWVTYTAHLFKSLCANGVRPYLFKQSNKSENTTRPYAQSVHYQNLSGADLLSLDMPVLIVALDKNYMEIGKELLKRGAQIVIHDTMEQNSNFISYLKKNEISPITIRPIVSGWFADQGIHAPYIPHPYVRQVKTAYKKTRKAVATSRIDFDKHTEIICAANVINPSIDIYGAENRLFTFHKIEKEYPNWRERYHGQFKSVYPIVGSADYMVDMTAIHQDGGGSQYTFLEAWDTGTICVLNKAWDVGGVMEDSKTCLYVENAQELSETLRREPDPQIIQNGYEALKDYDGARIGEIYLEKIGFAP